MKTWPSLTWHICFSFVSKTAQKLNLKVKFYKTRRLCTSDGTCSLAIMFQVDIMNDKTQNNRQKNYFLKFFYSKTKRLILKSKKNRMSTSQNSIQNPSQIRMQFVIFLYRQWQLQNVCQGRSQDFFRDTHNSPNHFAPPPPPPPPPPEKKLFLIKDLVTL